METKTTNSFLWEYFTGKEVCERGLIKVPTDEYLNDGMYIREGWYPVTIKDVKGDPLPFPNNSLCFRRRVY